MKNSVLKLPLQFDKDRLRNDLEICQQKKFTEHSNKAVYDGGWKGLSLRSMNGRFENIIPSSDPKSKFIDTPLLAECHYFRKILDSFECEKLAVRVLNLGAHTILREHNDPGLGYEFNIFRLYIPLATNDQVTFVVDGTKVNAKVGECWYANYHLPHWGANAGATDRVHFLMDCIRNQWTDKLFKEGGYDLGIQPEYAL